MRPYKSAILIWKAAHLSCPCKGPCLFCDNEDFCKAMQNAYLEAKKILTKEMIDALEEEQLRIHIIEEGE